MDIERAESPVPADVLVTVVTRQQLFEKMLETNLPTFEEMFREMATNILSSDNYSLEQTKDLKRQLSRLKCEFRRRWQEVEGHSGRFLLLNNVWLEGILTMPNVSQQPACEDTDPKTFWTLAMIVEADLSGDQYQVIRMTKMMYYPKYSIIEKAKLECYPTKRSYRLNDTNPEIQLQSLLNITVVRLMSYLDEWGGDSLSCDLMCWWGLVKNQAKFKQKPQDKSLTDSFFMTYFIPVTFGGGSGFDWINPKISSQRYCRPIRIRFLTEKTNVTDQDTVEQDEIKYIERVISDLRPFRFTREGVTYTVNFSMIFVSDYADVRKAALKTTSTITRYIETIKDELISQKIFTKDLHIRKLFNQMLLRSDPLLTSIRPKPNKKPRPQPRQPEDSDPESDLSHCEEDSYDSDADSWDSSSS